MLTKSTEEDCVDCEPMTVNINVTLAQATDSATEGFDDAYDFGYLEVAGEGIPIGLNIDGGDGEPIIRNPSVFDYTSPQVTYPSSTGLDVRVNDVSDDFEFPDQGGDDTFNLYPAANNWDD